jgi:hypothetical protein
MTSPSAADLTVERYLQQQAIARAAAEVAADSWRRISAADIVTTWVAELDRAVTAVAAAQQLAAEGANTYVGATLAAQGADTVPAGLVAPARLAGIASDGRPLASLLYQPAVQSLQAIGAGAKPGRALQLGRASLDMIVRTQVADAGRVATGVAITARPQVGYTRMLSGKSCSRCVVLAGKWYRWNTGFQRHPRCDCIHAPATKGFSTAALVNPRGYFDGLSHAEQDRTFTKAGAEAVRSGADLGQVVNARRGMAAAGTTAESTTRHGIAARGRLMPEEIYRRSDGDRTEALRLLQLHGYLI